MFTKLLYYGFIFFIVFLIVTIIWQINAYKNIAEPFYVTLKNEGSITIRKYSSITVAQVELNGDRYDSINSGFRLLANYIFGNNQEKQKITMTAPVIQTQIKSANPLSKNNKQENNKWIIRFIMPADYNQIKLPPKPNNLQVKILRLSEKKYIVIRFSGFNTDANLNRHLDELKNYADKNGFHTVGSPIYAFYNPPWMLPFLRRNEIMIELENLHSNINK